MVELDRSNFCAFHYENSTDGECANCGLNICTLDQDYDAQANRLCKLCYNITKAKPRIRIINYSLWAVVIAAVIIIWVTVENGLWFAMLPLILILVVPYLIRPYIMTLYFKDLEPKESILPILRYFEASGNLEHYNLFLKFAKNMTEEEIGSMEEKLYEYLVPSLSFNYSKLPEEWQKDITKNLKITEEQFVEILTKKYRTILLQTAVHNAQPNISQFIFYLSETAEDDKLAADYIKEITSPEILQLNDDELNIIYKKLLEDLYLFDSLFFEYCDKLGLEKEKVLITQLIERFVPPPVPKTQIEAVMTTEQLIEKRKKEETDPTKPLAEGDTPEVEFSEEK
ncbi:hypothetical protein EU534_01175 [Candidatus Heimdallarchaeota archaeon]|nr:MAG: hypothetical protein EU534_01175 [Candidatus Heimdallarchaeota archaeon]